MAAKKPLLFPHSDISVSFPQRKEEGCCDNQRSGLCHGDGTSDTVQFEEDGQDQDRCHFKHHCSQERDHTILQHRCIRTQFQGNGSGKNNAAKGVFPTKLETNNPSTTP